MTPEIIVACQKRNAQLFFPKTSEIKVKDFAVFDIETFNWTQPIMLGFYDGWRYYEFRGDRCCADFVDFLQSNRWKGKTIYSHNGGNYDHSFLIEHLTKTKGWILEATPIQSRMFRMDWIHVKSRKRITFLDSVCIIPMSLKEAAKTFDAPLKGDIDYENEKDLEVWSRYLRRDCESLFQVVTKFQRIVNGLGGQMNPTIASTSMDIYQRAFMTSPISVNRHWPGCLDETCPNSGCLGDFVRKGYYGGRTEVFRDEGKDLYYYDYNSHYPASMLEAMPGGEARLAKCDTIYEAKELTRHLVGIIEASVSLPDTCKIPPLPVRHNGKLVFPVGKFRGVWDAEELLCVVRAGGTVEKIHRSIWFEKTFIFGSFIDGLYPLKDKSHPEYSAGVARVAKLILNSLYGKFGIRVQREKFVFEPAVYRNLKPYCSEKDIWIEEIEIDPKYLIPQIAVRVTAIARRKLWEQMFRIEKNGGKVYYCDTDSIVTDTKLKTGKGLGQLDVEDFGEDLDPNKPNVQYSRFVLPKLYYIKLSNGAERIKSKGFSPGLGEQIKLKDFQKILLGHPMTRKRFLKIRETIRRKTSFTTVLESKKRIRSEYDKRTILPDGSTKPLRIEQ